MGDMLLTRVDATLPCTAVALHPEWAMETQDAVDAARQRSLAGRHSTVAWSRYAAFRVPLKNVPADAAALLRAWWAEGAVLAFTLDTSQGASTVVCAIGNSQLPLGDQIQPERDQWSGVLQLAARGPGGRQGRPFILDDPQLGRLDDPLITLVE